MVEGNAVVLFLKSLFLFSNIAHSFNVTQTPRWIYFGASYPFEKKNVFVIHQT